MPPLQGFVDFAFAKNQGYTLGFLMKPL